jgi:hypothetical protein
MLADQRTQLKAFTVRRLAFGVRRSAAQSGQVLKCQDSFFQNPGKPESVYFPAPPNAERQTLLVASGTSWSKLEHGHKAPKGD